MRTTKMFTFGAVTLALLCSAGCACRYYDTYPAYDCPPGYQVPQTVDCQPCPPPAYVERPRAVRYGRRVQRFARTRPAPAYGAQTYQDLGTATLVTDPGYVPTVVAGQESVAVPAYVEPVPVVAPAEPRPNTRVVYRRGRIQKRPRAAKVAPPVYGAPGTTYPAPVYAGAPYYASDYAPEAAVIEPAVAEPVAEPVVEPVAEVEIDEPSYARYLIPADAVPADAQEDAEPAPVAAAAPTIIDQEPPVAALPVPVQTAPVVVPPIMADQTFAQQPVAQVSPYQVQGQQPLNPNTVQLQQLYQERLRELQQLQMQIYQQQVYQQQMNQQGMYQAPVVSEPMYAMMGPVNSGFEPGLFSSTYCPPDICPVPYPVVCAPGQNLSECFTMNEYQVLNTPQPIYTPEAMRPLSIAVQPAAMPNTALINPPAPVAPRAPAAPAAPAVGGTSKYEALTPPAEFGRQNPPAVTMPTPIGNGSGNTMPSIAPTSEIENALDAMLTRDPQNPGMLK